MVTERKSIQKCTNCMFCFYNEKEDELECRRNAPKIIHGAGTGWNGQLFPFIKSDLVCGEFMDDTTRETYNGI